MCTRTGSYSFETMTKKNGNRTKMNIHLNLGGESKLRKGWRVRNTNIVWAAIMLSNKLMHRPRQRKKEKLFKESRHIVDCDIRCVCASIHVINERGLNYTLTRSLCAILLANWFLVSAAKRTYDTFNSTLPSTCCFFLQFLLYIFSLFFRNIPFLPHPLFLSLA